MKKYKSFQTQVESKLTDLECAKIAKDEAMLIFIDLKVKYTAALEHLSEAQHEYLVELEKQYYLNNPKP